MQTNSCKLKKMLAFQTRCKLLAAAALVTLLSIQLPLHSDANQEQQESHHLLGTEEAANQSIRNVFHHAQLEQHNLIGLKAFSEQSRGSRSRERQLDSLSSGLLKAFIRTNDMRAYHLDLHSYRPEARFTGDAAFVDSSNLEHKVRCKNHLNKFQQLLETFKTSSPVHEQIPLDSIKLADTFGRPESGLLRGNQFWLGQYEGCNEFEHQDEESSELLRAQYCLGISQFPNWNPEDGKTSIKVGLCLPEACSNSMLNEDSESLVQVEQLMKYQFDRESPFGQIRLRSIYCLPHKTSEARKLGSSAIWLLAVVGLFVLTCIIATTLDLLRVDFASTDASRLAIIVDSFSLLRNLRRFNELRGQPTNGNKQVEVDDTQQEFIEEQRFERSTFFNITTGIKCIGLIWIIAAHTFMVAPILGRNGIDADKLTKTILSDVYVTAHLMVDTFFALSGILASYLIFRQGIQTLKARDWIALTIHRYWRLTPIYILCYWYTKSLGHLIGSGPLWDYSTASQSPRLNCAKESWLTVLLYLSDFKSPKEHCVPFAWFIANGIKFWILTPLFLIAIHRSVKRGYMLSIGTCIASAILVTILGLGTEVDVKAVVEFKPEAADNMLNNMGQIYTRPYSRIGAYLIGLLAGHLIYLSEAGQLRFNLSKQVSRFIWALVICTVLLFTFILKVANSFKLEEQVLSYVFAISSALIRPIWALCSCWLVFALSHGQARWLANFLSLNCWQLLVKLSFCAYLIQGEVIAYLYLTSQHSEHFTYLDMISRPLTATFATICVSFLMLILFEYPLLGIERLLLPSKQEHRVRTKSQAGESRSQESIHKLNRKELEQGKLKSA